MSDLTASLQAFQATLSPQEQSELTSMERAAMIAETRDLLNKTRKNKGGAMGTMSRQAQAAPPPQGAPPVETAPKMSQATAPVPPGTPPPKVGQDAMPPVPPPQTPPAVVGQAAMPPAMEPAMEPSEGIDSYIDEKEEQAGDELSGGEMGIKEPGKIAAYVEAYGHLRIRPTVKNALEVFDPNNNATLLLIRPNASTRKNAQRLRRCAVDVLASIAHHGLVKTAQMWRGQIRRASGGVVDYGTSAMQVQPKFSDNSINDRGETSMQRDIALGVDTTTGEGDNLAAEDKPDTRQPAGLSGKSAQKVPAKGGILPGHDTNMADPPAKSPEGNALSALDNSEDTLRDKRPEKNKGSDDTLSDAITTFANETLTAGLRYAQAALPGEPPMGIEKGSGCGAKQSQDIPMDAPMTDASTMDATAQAAPGAPPAPPAPMPQMAEPDPGMAPPAPGMGPDAIPQTAQADDPTMMTDEQKIARLYRKRAEKQVAENTRKFIARFVRCLRVAARRQSLNLEPNQLKIAVADALMTEAALSKHEVYMPMDARTATFVIERGLDQRNAMAFVDSLIKRSAAFMKMSDEALTQVEEDLENIQPVEPTAKGAQMESPAQPSVMPGMPQMAQDSPDANPDMVPGMDGEMPMAGQMDPSMDPNMPMAGQMDPSMDPSMGGMPTEAGELVDWAQEEEAEHAHQGQGPGVAGQPGGMELDNPMTQTEEQQRAAAQRRRASGGNLPINPGAVAPRSPQQPGGKRDQIRFAVSATKSAALHNYFGGRR